jgi:steroid 5-alpha reductase family enzyme
VAVEALFIVTLWSALAALVFMSGVFLIGRHLKRYDSVDVAWGLVFIVIALTALLVSGAPHLTSVVVMLCVLIWGLRLSTHIYRRLRASTSEDKRYVALRQKWRSGNEAVAVFFRIYMVQAILAVMVSAPVLVSAAGPESTSPVFLFVGFIIWVVGLSIEAIADRQLRQFIRTPHPKGQLMTEGLWRYSRHPNYFGELLLWWGVGVMALGTTYSWIGLIGPMVISILIIFISGIPPTERAFAGRSGWAAYKAQTSVLIPWPVKKEARP